MSSAEARLTTRQREWLEHLRACERGSETIRAYARRCGMSAPSLYQAASALRRLGVLPAASKRCESSRKRRASRKFVALGAVRASESGAPSWRARLPNGVVLEGSGGVDGALLTRLAAL